MFTTLLIIVHNGLKLKQIWVPFHGHLLNKYISELVYLYDGFGIPFRVKVALVPFCDSVRVTTIIFCIWLVAGPETSWLDKFAGVTLDIDFIGAATSQILTLFSSCYYIPPTQLPTLVSTIVGSHPWIP